ncbi:ZIP family metal transporter [Bacillus sp. V59.32b]|uniref:ZIP family metal transporter n=1 Tax=Bacillus sp. V59.32b TaxID=1758642 RepID=UPI000E3CB310|nr:ZIP family metal transporter [Bacillus sp. V59.32b]RFU62699.1 zinc transporter [Bacillus sp. V59.32b]
MAEELKASIYIILFILMGALAGGVSAKLLSIFFKGNYRYLQIFCGGMIAGLLALDVVPEIIKHYRPIGIFTGVSIGVLFMLLLDRYLHQERSHSFQRPSLFIMLFLALIIHSIPTGIALGMSFHNQHFQDESLLAVILLHHIPEGMVMMITVLVSNVKDRIFVFSCVLLSISIGITTFIGMNIDSDSIKLHTLFLGAAIGTLCYVIFHEILWNGFKVNKNSKMIIVAILGFLAILPFLHISGFSH